MHAFALSKSVSAAGKCLKPVQREQGLHHIYKDNYWLFLRHLTVKQQFVISESIVLNQKNNINLRT